VSAGAGALVGVFGLSALPNVFQGAGMSFAVGIQATFLLLAALLFCTATTSCSLLRQPPSVKRQEESSLRLLWRGLLASRNRHIMLAHVSSFIARGNSVVMPLYLGLWLTTEEGYTRLRMLTGITQVLSLVWAPPAGVLADQLSRAKALVVHCIVGTVGFLGLGLTTDAYAGINFLWAVLIGVTQMGTLICSQCLLAQEAKNDLRGSISGVFGTFGGLGILLAQQGGYLSDAVSPNSPFILWAAVHLAVAVCGTFVALVPIGGGRVVSKRPVEVSVSQGKTTASSMQGDG